LIRIVTTLKSTVRAVQCVEEIVERCTYKIDLIKLKKAGVAKVLTLGDISDLIKSDFLLVILEVDEIHGILQVEI